jgi:uncharacterized membrane protein
VERVEGTSALSRWGLRALWVFTGFTLIGFATFGVNPQLLASFPSLASFYGYAFRFFAVGNVWLAWIVFAIFLTVYARLRWLPAFGAAYVISLSAELMGTRFGIPFGGYDYTSLMEPMWFGRVPTVIPLSWFYMALPAYALARAGLRGGEASLWKRVMGGGAILVLWDLSLDPAMSYATSYWVWESAGPYYGMPWVNLLGWFATGIVLMLAFHLLGTDRWIDRLPLPWIASYYLANMALPLGMNAAAGLWLAVAATVGVAALGWAIVRTPLRSHGLGIRSLWYGEALPSAPGRR